MIKRLGLLGLALLLWTAPAFAAVTATSVTLTWTLATDPDNAQNTLRYEVCEAPANTIATVTGCEAAMLVQPLTANIATATVTGLTPATTLWFNVVVADPVGNKTPYVPLMVTTLPDTTPPVPGNNGILIAMNFVNFSVRSVRIPGTFASQMAAYQACNRLVDLLWP